MDEGLNIDNRFTHHPPDALKQEHHEKVRAQFKALAKDMEADLPAGRERSLVITKLEEALMWANAAIARN